MLRCAIGGVLLAFAIIALGSGSAAGRDKDKIIGAVAKWDWSVCDEKDKEIATGSFTVHGFEIMKNGKRIGTYDVVSETQVKVSISEGMLRGKLDLSKDKPTAVNWKGELKSDNGQTYKISVVFVTEK